MISKQFNFEKSAVSCKKIKHYQITDIKWISQLFNGL